MADRLPSNQAADQFLTAASVPVDASHGSGSLTLASRLLAESPELASLNIFTASSLGNHAAVQTLLAQDSTLATAKGGPHDWDALTYLCFSRFLRISASHEAARSEAFVNAARTLLEHGANPNTGWYEVDHRPYPKRTFESALYGAAGVARNADLTRLLLAHGADPNDDETAYHAAESYQNDAVQALLESGKLNPQSLVTLLVRKADLHDFEGMRLILQYKADPNLIPVWGYSALHQALRRDNSLVMIELLLEHGGNPALRSTKDNCSAVDIAAERGRGDVLRLLLKRSGEDILGEVNPLLAFCALGACEDARKIAKGNPLLRNLLLKHGGGVLAKFAGNGNVEGLRCLLQCGADVAARYSEGDPYFRTARESTALHVAAWRNHPKAVALLIEAGAPVNAADAEEHTPLDLAVRACVDSYWMAERSPLSIAHLLQAGATRHTILKPTGYDEADKLLFPHSQPALQQTVR